MEGPSSESSQTHVVFTLWNSNPVAGDLEFLNRLIAAPLPHRSHLVWFTREGSPSSIQLELQWARLADLGRKYTIELVDYPQSLEQSCVSDHHLASRLCGEWFARDRADQIVWLQPSMLLSNGLGFFSDYVSALDVAFPLSTSMYRISPIERRSQIAFDSQRGLPFIEIPSVEADDGSLSAKERAATMAHGNVMRAFLASESDFAVVIEDDAILLDDRSWMDFKTFDIFIPFSHNREFRQPDSRIRFRELPEWGAFAYVCSRRFAEALLSLLEQGDIADHALKKAASRFVVGSFTGNLVVHDNLCASLISEGRRRHFLRHNTRSASHFAESTPDIHIGRPGGTRVLIAVCSCQGNEEKREAIRQTWWPRDCDTIQALFFTGEKHTSEMDTIALDVDDHYEQLPAKVRAFFKHALRAFAFDWIFKCDDDTYVAVDRLSSLLGTHDFVGNEFLARTGDSQFASGGAGYLLSRRAVECLVSDDRLALSGAEDVLHSQYLLRAGLSWRSTSRLCWNDRHVPSPENDIISSHWIEPAGMYAIHLLLEHPARRGRV